MEHPPVGFVPVFAAGYLNFQRYLQCNDRFHLFFDQRHDRQVEGADLPSERVDVLFIIAEGGREVEDKIRENN